MSSLIFKKTSVHKRDVYKYYSSTGEVVTVTIEQIGKEWIDWLHRMDDKEVYNNLKNSRPAPTTAQKEAIAKWKELHPGEEAPTNWNLSLDGLLDGDNPDHSSYMKEVTDKQLKLETDPHKELLYEWLEEMSPEVQKLYSLYYAEERTQTEIAHMLGISQRAVSKRLQKITEALQKKHENSK